MQININIQDVVKIAESAASLAKSLRNNHLKCFTKSDNSECTNADIEVSEFLEAELKNIIPQAIIISEESSFNKISNIDNSKFIWLIDPIDGTKGYIGGSKEYCVLISLLINFKPVIGVISAPELDLTMYNNFEMEVFAKSFNSKPLQINNLHNEETSRSLTVLVGNNSKSKIKELSGYIRTDKEIEIKRTSSAIKFMMLANNQGDLYINTGKTHEWDTAAGHAILKALGGNIYDKNFCELSYGKDNLLNSNFFAFASNNKAEFLIKDSKK